MTLGFNGDLDQGFDGSGAWFVLYHEAKRKILIQYNELIEVLGFGESILDSFNSFVARRMIE